VVLGRGSNFDDFQPELGDFSLEMDTLLFAVLGLIELGSLVHIFHSVAQHAVEEPGEFGGPSRWSPPEVPAPGQKSCADCRCH
jgi:hypothetical protein